MCSTLWAATSFMRNTPQPSPPFTGMLSVSWTYVVLECMLPNVVLRLFRAIVLFSACHSRPDSLRQVEMKLTLYDHGLVVEYGSRGGGPVSLKKALHLSTGVDHILIAHRRRLHVRRGGDAARLPRQDPYIRGSARDKPMRCFGHDRGSVFWRAKALTRQRHHICGSAVST